MITFKRKTFETDMIPEAIRHLESEKIDFNVISQKEAEAASKVNAKSMVLMSFVKTEKGFYQITVKDKEFYNYTKKLLSDPNYCRMRIVDEDKNKRTVTVETNHLGIVLDVIEILGIKYNLSIVKNDKV